MNCKRPLFRDGRCPRRRQERFGSLEGLECSFAITSAVPPRRLRLQQTRARAEHASRRVSSGLSRRFTDPVLRRCHLHSNQASTDVRGPRVRARSSFHAARNRRLRLESLRTAKRSERWLQTHRPADVTSSNKDPSHRPHPPLTAPPRRNLLMFSRSHRSCSCHSGCCAVNRVHCRQLRGKMRQVGVA
ncbi:hypothetical protein PYCCODRAFT_55750 [Trametes coccinea BRFM310]|uniref:Uncharacterized protein n=1 Tax=Trametes coccinea (strain BRFM310) TaxID=1353009 RepID=A0A1Y2J5V5_TRAC3|nr:hypothetical protein PYCCODRAFT_55750 [Trametes coccinea BRFM310]